MVNEVKVGTWYRWEDSKTHFKVTRILNQIVSYEYGDGFTATDNIKDFKKHIVEHETLNNKVEGTNMFEEATDNVVNPAHYTTTKISALQVVNDWELCFYLGNALKYMKRYKLKGNPIQDLEKAVQYLNLKIELMKKENE